MAQINGTVVQWDQLHSLPVGSLAVSSNAYYMVVPGGVVVHSITNMRATHFYNYRDTMGDYLQTAATITHVGAGGN